MNPIDLDLDLAMPCGTADELEGWMDSARGKLEMKLARNQFTNDDVLYLAGCSLAKTPGKDNWVDEQGGLPEYICKIARSIHQKRGMPISQAIAIAVGTVKRWARGGGDVDADTRAKAAAAVASWEKKKAAAKAS